MIRFCCPVLIFLSDKGSLGRLMADDSRFFEKLNSTLKNLDEITA